MNKHIAKKVFFALFGAGYLIAFCITVIDEIGTSYKPTEFTVMSAVQVMNAVICFHWSIEWVKDLFKEK